MKFVIHFQTPMVAPLKLKSNFFHTLLDMWLLIHAGYTVSPCQYKRAQVLISPSQRTNCHKIPQRIQVVQCTVYPKKYAHGFCFAVLCCGYTLTDFPISIRLTSLALWQSNDCPSASKATLMNMDKYFIWIHYERLHNHNKAKHNKTVCIFLGIYCMPMTALNFHMPLVGTAT